MLAVYGDSISGNCHKVRFVADRLGLPYRWIETSVLKSETRTHLASRRYFAGDALSLADVALVAYTRLAHEGGFDLSGFPHVAGWVRRIENDLGISAAR